MRKAALRCAAGTFAHDPMRGTRTWATPTLYAIIIFSHTVSPVSQLDSMRFAARPLVVGKLLSQLYGLLAALTTVPCLVAFLGGSTDIGWRYVIVIAVLATLALVGRTLAPTDRVQTNEALVVVGLLFVTASLFMTVPLMGYDVRFIDAWFEAVSGVTTTGLSTLSLAGKPDAFLFSRAWMQWIGGVGVTVFALALLAGSDGPARSLGFSSTETGDVVGGTRAHAKRVVIIYVCLTAFGITALLLSGAPLIDAVAHSMAAVSTGGFANYGDSLASVSAIHVSIVNVLCVAGAVSFHVYYFSLLAIRRGRDLDNQLFALLGVVGIGTLLVWMISWLTQADIALGDLLTLVVSAQTTAGFASTDVGALPNWLIMMLCLAMVVGGGIGSTAGGIKLGRVLFVLSRLKAVLVRASLPPRVFVDVRMAGQKIDPEGIEDVIAVITGYALILALSWFAFLVHGYAPMHSLFEVSSALATAGLSSGVTSADLATPLKLVLIADMLFGRLEVLVLLVLLAPRTWIGRRRPYRKE